MSTFHALWARAGVLSLITWPVVSRAIAGKPAPGWSGFAPSLPDRGSLGHPATIHIASGPRGAQARSDQL